MLLVTALLTVVARCWVLQNANADQYQQRALRQQLKIIPHNTRRGLIVDRNGSVMAISRKVPMVWADPTRIQNIPETCQKIAPVLGLNENELLKNLETNKDRRFLWIKRDPTQEQADRITELDIPGIKVDQCFRRDYPMNSLAAHVIGFTDIDGIGLEGVEAAYNQYLNGQPGRMLFCSDVKRRPVASRENSRPGADGQTLVLTIDAVIQACVESELQKVVEKFQAKGATAIVMEPHTGEILALANLPTFNPATARTCHGDLRRNRALTDPYEPGSTFKPFTVTSALEGKFVTMETEIDCLDQPYRGKGFRPIKEYKYYFGPIPVSHIIINSSNIGSAKLAQKMGKDYFHNMIEKFGFGKKTGIDLPGENEGILSPEWNDKEHTLTRVGFGQGIAVTPIQLIRGFCTIANGGILVKPRLARGILDAEGKIVEDFGRCQLCVNPNEPIPASDAAGRVISRQVAREMIDKALVGVVERKAGTAHNAHLEEWTVFGKTGTAQIARKDGPGYEENKYISSFIAGAPAEYPCVCVLVIVREPDRSLGFGYTGGAVAAPTVKEILRQTLAYLHIPKNISPEEIVTNNIAQSLPL